MQKRVSVLSPEGTPLMPTKASRARRWIKEGKAVRKFNDLGQFYLQLKVEPSDRKTQPISCGIDPGKLYSGIGVQSAKFTLWTGHLELPFKKVRERMDNRRMMRRGRRGRRINRKLLFHLRAHRQKRFDNRKQGKLPPSIRANRQLELRVVKELCQMYPITDIYFEYVKADVDLRSGRKGARSGKGFSAVMVGQNFISFSHTTHSWDCFYYHQKTYVRLYSDYSRSSHIHPHIWKSNCCSTSWELNWYWQSKSQRQNHLCRRRREKSYCPWLSLHESAECHSRCGNTFHSILSPQSKS